MTFEQWQDEKAQSRRKDIERVRLGLATAEEIQRENEFMSPAMCQAAKINWNALDISLAGAGEGDA